MKLREGQCRKCGSFGYCYFQDDCGRDPDQRVWPWPEDEPSTGDLRDRLAKNHERLLKELTQEGEPSGMTRPSPLQEQYEWEREFATGQPDGVTCQIADCTGNVNWGWCSVHTPLHYRELP